MKISKRLCMLILCLGVVGGASACDMSMLTSMIGGSESVAQSVESGDTTSVEKPDGEENGESEFPNVKGDPVTNLQWKSAFELLTNPTNVTVSRDWKKWNTVEGAPSDSSVRMYAGSRVRTARFYSVVVDPDTMKEEERYQEDYYEILEDGSVAAFRREDMGATWAEFGGQEWGIYKNIFSEMYQNFYDAFTYNPETGYYTVENLDLGEHYIGYKVGYVIAFQGDKVYQIKETMLEEKTGAWTECFYTFRDYGTTVVDRPAGVNLPDGGGNGDVTQDQWNEAIKDEKFNNVTFAYSVLFSDKEERDTGIAYLDGEYVAYAEGDGSFELMDAESAAALRDVYISTTLAVVENFTSFTYDVVSKMFVSTADIVYEVNVLGIEATITASNVSVKLDQNNNIAEIACDMKHEYVENGRDCELVMDAIFTFTNYGTTVIDFDSLGGKPDGGETPGDKPNEGETPGGIPDDETPGDNESEDEAWTDKETWDKLFEKSYSYENYKMEIVSRNDREGDISESSAYYNINSNAVYVSSNGRYYEQVDGKSFWYFLVDGEWVKEPFDGNMMYGSDMIKANLSEYQKMFEYFTYDEETNSYYAQNVPYKKNGTTITLYELRVYIENGMVVKVYSDSDILKTSPVVEVIGRSQTTMTFIDFGVAVVKLPTEYRDETKPNMGAEDLWHSAFEKGYASDNYTIHVDSFSDFTNGDDDRENIYTQKYDKNVLMSIQTSYDRTCYYTTEGENTFEYDFVDGKWKREIFTPGVQYGKETFQITFGRFEELYEYFTYDETTGVYSAENIVTEMNGVEMVYHKVQVKIADGYIVYLEVVSNIISSREGVVGKSTMKITFSDYGTTVVELPTIEEETVPAGKDIWDTAFAALDTYENYTLTYATAQTLNNGEYSEATITYKGNYNVLFTAQDGVPVTYIEQVGEKKFLYNMNNGEWTKKEYSTGVPMGAAYLKANFVPFEELYEHFTYDETTGVYSAENVLTKRNTHDMMVYEAHVYIVNGVITKITSVSDVINGQGMVTGRVNVEFELFDLGTTVVKLPAVDAETRVTEAEWAAAMDLAVSTNNVTAYMCYIYDYTDETKVDEVMTSYMRLQENSTFQWGDDYQQAYAKEDGVDYAYYFNNGIWTKSELGKEVTYTNYRMESIINPIASLYANFRYNEGKGVYFLESAMVDAGNGTMTELRNIEVGFENGQLTYLYFEMDMTNREGEKAADVKINMELWDYGTTIFALPKVA